MATQNVIIDGNVLEDMVISGSSYIYDDLLMINCKSVISNNSLNAGPTNNAINCFDESIISSNYIKPQTNVCKKSIYVTAASLINGNSFDYCSVVSIDATASCVISNNTFANSNLANINLTASSTITGNRFGSLLSNSGTFISLTNCQCKITNNTFRRASRTVVAYINIFGTSGHTITDNVFDNSTIDGSSELLVGGVTSIDLVTRNKNQIFYMMTMPSDHTTGGLLTSCNSGGPTTSTFLNNVCSITTSTGVGGVAYHATIYINLSRLIPYKSKLLGTLTGLQLTSAGANLSTTANTIILTSGVFQTDTTYPLNGIITGLNPLLTPTTTLANKTSSSVSVLSGSSPIQLQSVTLTSTSDTTTKYLNADYLTNSLYNDEINDLIYRLDIQFRQTGSSGTTTFGSSPVLIRYSF